LNSNDDALAGAASGKEATGGEALTTFRGVTVLDDEAFLGGISFHRAKPKSFRASNIAEVEYMEFPTPILFTPEKRTAW
jgi:hypothetical protein